MTLQAITEKDGVHKQWYLEAHDVKTPAELASFVTKLLTEYAHDYGTICHAVAAAAAAGAWCVNADKDQGGITGFQAGAVMWEFIRAWQHWDENHLGARLQLNENLLYPQYEYKYRTIQKETFEALQKRAAEMLVDTKGVSPTVRAHWESIVAGEIPFGLQLEPRS